MVVAASETRKRGFFARRRALFALLLCAFATVACILQFQPQGWPDRRGPVVPHDTFPADCSLCHTSAGWETLRSDFSFDHGAETGYALDGAHDRVECLLCHNDRGPVQRFSARGCAGCHVDPHMGRLGVTCDDCHTEHSWQPKLLAVQHALGRFPLFGAHAATACSRCHEGADVGNFQRVDTRCESCHQADLARAQNPDHIAQGWVSGCDRCHVSTVWNDARFAHPVTFPLVGAHGAALCESCHVGGVFTGLDPDCVSCHLSDYQGATDPNHIASSFPTDCDACHGTATWDGALFAHTSVFPLTGAHVAADCNDCHVGGVFTGLSSDCVSCHLTEYQGTTNPNHIASGFPTDCDACHNTSGWPGAVFAHTSAFPLTGAHVAADCNDCHTGGVFTGLSSDCVSCHLSDYQGATNPNHITAGFPTDCDACHNTTGWDGANFVHSPVNRGNHSGLDCLDCHEVPSNFTQYTCTNCHEHTQSEMDDDHDEVGGYVYNSMACFNCHPDGDD